MKKSVFLTPILIGVLAALMLGLAEHSAVADPSVDGICGVYPVDDSAFIAVKIVVPEDHSLSGLRWFNNDGQQPFAGLIFLEGQRGSAPDLSGGALVLGEIWGLSSDWSQVDLGQPIVSSSGVIDAVYILPAGGTVASEGAFGGPGIGYSSDGAGLSCYLSADGIDWSALNEHYGLAVEPVFSSGSSKQAPLEIGSLESWDGRPPLSGSTSEQRKETPKTALLSPRPNPFNPQTEIRYSMAAAGRVKMVIYDVRGRLVRTLVSEHQSAGLHSALWMGRDDRGSRVASGAYFLRMTFGERVLNQRLMLVK